jgi:beta-galactosidase
MNRAIAIIIVGVFFGAVVTAGFAETYQGEPSNRIKINLGATPWKMIKSDPSGGCQSPTYNDAAAVEVGIPQCYAEDDMFVNNKSGGGNLPGGPYWYRKKFALSATQADKRIFLVFEGAHTGIQVYVNGTLCKNKASTVNPNATHVIGFVGFTLDITDLVKFDGTDNVVAARVSMNAAGFFESPGFAGVFRFGQGSGGPFRPVWLYLTDKVYIPTNEHGGNAEWGTYVATTSVAADGSSATVRLLTNVHNTGGADAAVALTTKVVDAVTGTVVLSSDATKTVPAGATVQFDQTGTIANPKLWYPNNSTFGKPNMHRVYHIVKVGGKTVDVVESPLGLRTITWDKDYPYINGHKHCLYGAAARYDYPALGTALPPEVEWRDAKLLADIGGNLWRPGHSSCSPAFVDACDAFGIMIIQPSGEGEGSFSTTSINTPATKRTVKKEIHRDVIIRDRNHPSILAWEGSNAGMDPDYCDTLRTLGRTWDSLAPKAMAVRGTPYVAGQNDLHGCTLTGCDAQQKPLKPDWPWWGSEYWGRASARYAYNNQVEFSGEFLRDWAAGIKNKCFGMVQWYMSETPGECKAFVEDPANDNVRSFGCSLLDCNRIPKFLYYQYAACWTPFSIKPRVAIANTWNRSGTVRVDVWSNCPKVRLSVNNTVIGTQAPNGQLGAAAGINDVSNTTTQLPFQCVFTNVTWAAGTIKAEGLDAGDNVVCTDTKVTAGAPHHIVLTKDAPIVNPITGKAFAITANGTDAAMILATVVDDKGNWCPDAGGLITWKVAGPATYRGGSDQLYNTAQGLYWHAPRDSELTIEGGMAKVAIRSKFQTGTVTVSATATTPGLTTASATMTYDIVPVTDQLYVGAAIPAPRAAATAIRVKTAVRGCSLVYQLASRAIVGADILSPDGKIVRKIPAGAQAAGAHSISLDTKRGDLSAGLYFVRLSVDGIQQKAEKITLIK